MTCDLQVGDVIESGDTAEDYDSGIVVETADGRARVLWQEARFMTWQTCDSLVRVRQSWRLDLSRGVVLVWYTAGPVPLENGPRAALLDAPPGDYIDLQDIQFGSPTEALQFYELARALDGA